MIVVKRTEAHAWCEETDTTCTPCNSLGEAYAYVEKWKPDAITYWFIIDHVTPRLHTRISYSKRKGKWLSRTERFPKGHRRYGSTGSSMLKGDRREPCTSKRQGARVRPTTLPPKKRQRVHFAAASS